MDYDDMSYDAMEAELRSIRSEFEMPDSQVAMLAVMLEMVAAMRQMSGRIQELGLKELGL